MRKQQKRVQHDQSTNSIVGVIFEERLAGGSLNKGRFLHPSLSWGSAVFVHLVLFIFANNTEMSLETWSARMATLIHQELAKQAPVTVDSLKINPPSLPKLEAKPVVEQVKEPEPPKVKKIKQAKPKPPSLKKVKVKSRQKSQIKKVSSSPAQAAKIIASPATANTPLDLTKETFITGEGHTFAGGVTTSQGQSKKFVDEVTVEKEMKQKKLLKKAVTPVTLSSGAWRCAWPQKAMEQAIFEQSVVLKVVVEANGKVAKVLLLDDPGFGFGEAARRCALQTKFIPAKNHLDQPIRASSPPIRVRFTR